MKFILFVNEIESLSCLLRCVVMCDTEECRMPCAYTQNELEMQGLSNKIYFVVAEEWSYH